MGKPDKPIQVDSEGNGLYALSGGGFAFVDITNPEDRYCQDMSDMCEAQIQEDRRQEAFSDKSAETLAREQELEEAPWRADETPSGLMFDVDAENHNREAQY
jgi:hypothetical protein